jgi:hypothetical protein
VRKMSTMKRMALVFGGVTALVVWAISEKGLAALPSVLLYAVPYALSATWCQWPSTPSTWQYLARRYSLPQSTPDQACVPQLRRWRDDRRDPGQPQRPLR